MQLLQDSSSLSTALDRARQCVSTRFDYAMFYSSVVKWIGYTQDICRRTACSSSLSKVQHSGRIRFVENWKICTLHGKLLFFENFGDFFRLYILLCILLGEKFPGLAIRKSALGLGSIRSGIRDRWDPIPTSRPSIPAAFGFIHDDVTDPRSPAGR